MIFNIALRELRSLFLSPLAWVVLAVTQIILAMMASMQMQEFFKLQDQLATLPDAPGVTDLIIAPMFDTASILLLLVTPLITMRLFSEESRSGTLNLLFAAPLSSTEIVIGKFLGAVVFMLVFMAMISLLPLSLNLGTDIDSGKLLSGLIGLTLLVTAFTAAGLFISSLTDNPVIAAIASFGLLLVFWLIDLGSAANASRDDPLAWLSLLKHFAPMLRGIIDSRDVVYFLLFISGFVILTIRQLDARRLQG